MRCSRKLAAPAGPPAGAASRPPSCAAAALQGSSGCAVWEYNRPQWLQRATATCRLRSISPSLSLYSAWEGRGVWELGLRIGGGCCGSGGRVAVWRRVVRRCATRLGSMVPAAACISSSVVHWGTAAHLLQLGHSRARLRPPRCAGCWGVVGHGDARQLWLLLLFCSRGAGRWLLACSCPWLLVAAALGCRVCGWRLSTVQLGAGRPISSVGLLREVLLVLGCWRCSRAAAGPLILGSAAALLLLLQGQLLQRAFVDVLQRGGVCPEHSYGQHSQLGSHQEV
jgi:hypothetical protein